MLKGWQEIFLAVAAASSLVFGGRDVDNTTLVEFRQSGSVVAIEPQGRMRKDAVPHPSEHKRAIGEARREAIPTEASHVTEVSAGISGPRNDSNTQNAKLDDRAALQSDAVRHAIKALIESSSPGLKKVGTKPQLNTANVSVQPKEHKETSITAPHAAVSAAVPAALPDAFPDATVARVAPHAVVSGNTAQAQASEHKAKSIANLEAKAFAVDGATAASSPPLGEDTAESQEVNQESVLSTSTEAPDPAVEELERHSTSMLSEQGGEDADPNIQRSAFGISIGAGKHDVGKCRPCHYVISRIGCQKGEDCEFCHMPHKRIRSRVVKAKREQMRKLQESYTNFVANSARTPPQKAGATSYRISL